ncbi:MAG: nucleoside diphosphate kinase regulator [Candidatus Competibacteraceae bacterium]
MSELPKITVSSLDLQRLEALLETVPSSSNPEIEGLKSELLRANIVEPPEMPPTVVTMNSKVRFVVEDTGREFELTLCYPHDLDGQPDKISILAPIGSALLGLAVGQSIEWPLPGGKLAHVLIVDVLYQPERAGDYHR